MDPLMKLFGRPNLIAEFFGRGEPEESLLKYIKAYSELRVNFDDKLRPRLICESAIQARFLEASIEVCIDGLAVAQKLIRIADGPDRQEALKARRELRHVVTDLEPFWAIFQAWLKFQAEGAKFRSELVALRDSVDDVNFYIDLELTAKEVEQGH